MEGSPRLFGTRLNPPWPKAKAETDPPLVSSSALSCYASKVEYKEETIAKLRARLGREPTEAEIKEARDALWRKTYANMLISAVLLRDDR
jgi:hypothetical protein